MARRYAYLGPKGTFTEAALRTLDDAHDALLLPRRSVSAVFDTVRRGEADAAVAALESSVGGGVVSTIDELATGEPPLHITREIVLDVAFVLAARPGTPREAVKRLTAHPQAEAQCRRWIAGAMPDVEVVAAGSNAAAAAAVAEGSGGFDAAICSELAARTYGLEVLAADIHDQPDAVTRFVVVSAGGPLTAPTGADKTSLVAFIGADRSGALLELLTELAVRGVNLTRIESRPTGGGLGRYYFSIDCEGHVTEARVREALTGLRRVCARVRFLGSYPRADGTPPTIRPGTTDADFAEARTWLAGLLAGLLDPG